MRPPSLFHLQTSFGGGGWGGGGGMVLCLMSSTSFMLHAWFCLCWLGMVLCGMRLPRCFTSVLPPAGVTVTLAAKQDPQAT